MTPSFLYRGLFFSARHVADAAYQRERSQVEKFDRRTIHGGILSHVEFVFAQIGRYVAVVMESLLQSYRRTSDTRDFYYSVL